MEANTTAVATTTNNNNIELFGGKNYYSSIDTSSSVESQKKLYNAIEGCDVLIKDVIGQSIKLKDVYVEQYVKNDNGTEKVKFRTILFDEDGKSYVSTAYGIVNAIAKIIRIFGDPSTWTEPKEIQFAERPMKDGKKSFTIKLA